MNLKPQGFMRQSSIAIMPQQKFKLDQIISNDFKRNSKNNFYANNRRQNLKLSSKISNDSQYSQNRVNKMNIEYGGFI